MEIDRVLHYVCVLQTINHWYESLLIDETRKDICDLMIRNEYWKYLHTERMQIKIPEFEYLCRNIDKNSLFYNKKLHF